MSIYTFSGKPLEDLAHSVVLNDRFKLPFQEEWTDRKGVWLVKDAGIYLMNAHAHAAKLVVMCDEFNATMSDERRDEDTDAAMEMLGGDDFAEFLDADEEVWKLVAKGLVNLRVEMDADSFAVTLPPTAKGLAASTKTRAGRAAVRVARETADRAEAAVQATQEQRYAAGAAVPVPNLDDDDKDEESLEDRRVRRRTEVNLLMTAFLGDSQSAQ